MAETIRVVFNRRPTGVPAPTPSRFPSVSKIIAKLTSLENGLTLIFRIPPAEQERRFGSDWVEAEVAQAAVQFLEYKQSPPEERIYKVTFDAYSEGGIHYDIENEYQTLKSFCINSPSVPRRAHRLLYSQGSQSFRCVLAQVSMPVWRIATTGGALIAVDTQITLRELR